MKKILIFSVCCVLAVALAGFVFKEKMTEKLVIYYLQQYCRTCFNAELQYDKITKKEKQLVFEKPVLKWQGPQLWAKELLITYESNWSLPTIGQVKVVDGKAVLQDPVEEIAFEWQGRIHPIFEGRLTAQSHEGQLSLDIAKARVEAEGSRIPLRVIANVMTMVQPISDWPIQGELTGHLLYENETLSLDGKIDRNQRSIPLHVESRPDAPKALFLKLEGKGYDLAGLLPKGLMKWCEECFSEEEISIQSTLSKSSSGIKLEGNCQFSEADGDVAFQIDFNRDHAVITGKNFPLEKCTKAFFREKNRLKMEGIADFEGTFNQDTLSLRYSIQKFILDSPSFIFQTDTIQAEHQLDLNNGRFIVQAPIQNGVLLEKERGLNFTEIAAHIVLEPYSLRSLDFEAFYQGIYLTGPLDVEFSRLAEGYAEVHFHAEAMEGRLEQFMGLCDCAPPLPLYGLLSLRKQGAEFLFTIEPETTHLEAIIQGAVTEGRVASDSNLSLHDLSLNFDYNYRKRSLYLYDIQGALLVGSPHHSEEYIFAGDHVRIADLANSKADFDLWVGEKNRDIIRLVGSTLQIAPGRVQFSFDESQSHFGNVHPDLFHIVLSDWSHVDSFGLKLAFQLNTFLSDLQRFSRTGLLFLSRNLIKDLDHLKTAQGLFNIDLLYDDRTALFTYQIKGNDVEVDDYFFEHCSINGKKKDNTWTIDQLKLDDVAIAADLTTLDNKYRINFLGVQCGESLLMGLEGWYDADLNRLNAKVNLMEIRFEKMGEWPFLKTFVEQCQPKGMLSGTGDLQLSRGSKNFRWQAEAQLDIRLQRWGLCGAEFADTELIPASYVSNRGITVQNLRTSIKEYPLHFEKIHYDFIDRELALDDLRIKIQNEGVQQVDGMLFGVNMSMLCRMQPGTIHLENATLKNKACTLETERVLFKQDAQGKWLVEMPLMTMKKLQLAQFQQFKQNPYEIGTLELRGFKGALASPNTFSGEGRAYFHHSSKTDKASSIVQIPSEILSTLGLDLSTLSPVSGTVDYRLENGKVYLTKLKDVYSAGHLSKFYLSKKETHPSYVDFDGNIQMHVNVKQNNLLFKLRNFFTINVEGTIHNPKYSIVKD